MVLEGPRKYLWERRRTIFTTIGFLGSLWFVGRYVIGRLEEMRDRVMIDRNAKDNLRKRFAQNQEHWTYTMLAHLPMMGNAILEEMDVERITLALQQQRNPALQRLVEDSHGHAQLSASMLSEATSGESSGDTGSSLSSPPLVTVPPPAHAVAAAPPSNTASTTGVFHIPAPGTTATANTDPSFILPELNMLNSATSNATSASATSDWVREFQQQEQSRILDSSVVSTSEASAASISLPATTDSERDESESLVSAQSGILVDSSISSGDQDSSSRSQNNSGGFGALDNGLANSQLLSPNVDPRIASDLATKSKAELWKEMKILAFTRALTILYSVSLLALLTHIQLNLLGTRKYIYSVRELAKEAEQEDALRAPSSSSLLGSGSPIEGLMSLGAKLLEPFKPTIDTEDEDEEDSRRVEDDVLESDTEQKFLTMSWWLLNVGWKDVAERVREAVEFVFSSVSLKSQLRLDEIERLLGDVRKRVEFVLPGDDQRVSFLGTLIPNAETDQEFVLLQGGLPAHSAHLDRPLRSLLAQTSLFVDSADFGVVFDLAMGQGVQTLLRGLKDQSYFGLEESDGVRLASVLPSVARWSHLAVNGVPNELIETLGEMEEMTTFAAILFASFEERAQAS